MPTSHKSNEPSKTKTLKWRATKVVKANSPKKKKRTWPTDDDTSSIALTQMTVPETLDIDTNELTLIIDNDTCEENADAKLSTPSSIP